MYWENYFKISSREKKGSGDEAPRKVLLALPFRLLENVGKTFWACMVMSIRNPAMHHATILLTTCQYIQKFNYPRDCL